MYYTLIWHVWHMLHLSLRSCGTHCVLPYACFFFSEVAFWQPLEFACLSIQDVTSEKKRQKPMEIATPILSLIFMCIAWVLLNEYSCSFFITRAHFDSHWILYVVPSQHAPAESRKSKRRCVCVVVVHVLRYIITTDSLALSICQIAWRAFL